MTQSQSSVAGRFTPVSVPAPPAHFTGREAELAAVREALTADDTPQAIIGLQGVDGVGKTALAAQLAAQFADDFPGGIFWADLPAVGGDPLPVLGAWARLCGRDVSALHDASARAQAVRGLLADRVAERGRLLVVLDDVDVRAGWLEGARMLASARPPDVPLLVTTRDEGVALAMGCVVHRLSVLVPEQAVELLGTLAGPVVERDAGADRRLADRVGRLPLALELAGKLAARRAREPGFQLADLCAEVKARAAGRLQLVGQPGLVACFSLSYDALGAEAQRLFRALSAFAPAPIAAEHMAAVVGWGMGESEAALDALVALSLVCREGEQGAHRPEEPVLGRPPAPPVYGGAAHRPEEPVLGRPPAPPVHGGAAQPEVHAGATYSLHPLLREYSAALLEESGEGPAVGAAHITHYLAYARAHREATAADYDALEAERPNLLSAMDRAYREERWAQVRRFAQALCDPAGSYLHARGYWGELRARLEQAVRAAEAEGDDRDGVAFMGDLALVAQRMGDYPEAHRLYERVVKIEEGLGNRAGIAGTLARLANLAQAEGEYAEAQRLYRQSLDVYEELGAGREMAAVYHQWGDVSFLQGEHAEAQRLYQQALEIAERAGDRASIARSLHQLGLLAQRSGDYAEARRLYRESLDIAKELGNRAGLAVTLHELGNLASLTEVFSEAQRLYRRSLDIAEELGDRAGMASTLHQLGMVAQRAGDFAEARRLYRQSLEIEEELGNRAGVARSLHELGNLAVTTEEYAEARRLYRQSMEVAQQVEDRAGVGRTLGQLGNLALETGQYDEAHRLYRQSLVVAEELGDRAVVAIVLHQLGNLAYVRGEHAEARHLYERSLEIVEGLGDRAGVASTLGQLANLARAEGDLARAERLYRRNLTICQEMGDALTERTTLLNLALLYEDQGRLADALPLLERAVRIDEQMNLPTLEQDRSILRRVRLQMEPGCTGWVVRRATAFGRALRQLGGIRVL